MGLNDLDFSKSDLNNIQVNGCLGAGIDILTFTLDAGYSLGLIDIFNNDLKAKTNYIFVNIGLRF